MRTRSFTSRTASLRLLAVLFAVVVTVAIKDQVTIMAQSNAPELAITASFGDGRSVSPRDEIVLTLSRSVTVDEGRLAVLIGNTDISGLLTSRANSLIYSPRVVPLPIGDSSGQRIPG